MEELEKIAFQDEDDIERNAAIYNVWMTTNGYGRVS